ncbi:GntR family transcriptional regulator [Bacillus swezeyi]|uniref:GntR family transcriptional regulator n=1 Tax=Bacillus swezeyi TaxID=1925020 RepID=A0A5M8RZN8_9BACI|nr:GntR family transcriptional regulator [Bacillus swezeyi]KAA6453191.1 GntR family transcriptional regulator [Bacillus swezeyi]KAA6476190.1 GntR family transcriptional regulator [Bacillus swezeyi]TYS38561.1 GntR family transcriptional regulator [Bacillus swezeyi]
MNVKQSNLRSVRDQIYYFLMEDIMKFRLVPGTHISEKEISERYEVSRTPVREAFLQLSKEGLLEIYPQKGTRVSLIDLNLVEEARFMRENLEKAVAELACEEFSDEAMLELERNLKMQEMSIEQKNYESLFDLDEAFHKTIFEGCRKSNIWSVIQQMNVPFRRIRFLRLAADFNWNTIYQQHAAIAEAIKSKQPTEARRIAEEHLKLVIVDKEMLIEEFPGYFKK